MTDTTKTIIFLLGIFVGVPLLTLKLRDVLSDLFRNRRSSPQNRDAARQAKQQRLLQPDWKFYEQHLMRAAPVALRELYADRSLATAQGLQFDSADRISTFEALDEKGLLDSKEWLGFDAIAIATNEFGDQIYLRPGAEEPDTVYITRLDGGDTEVFANSVSEMIEKLKTANFCSRK